MILATVATRPLSNDRPAGWTNVAPISVHESLKSPGQPLDAAARRLMEHRFGRDFAAVRVHTDERASLSAREVDCAAYTVGSDIVFGSGEYQPQSGSGRQLIAHELTHVIQQTMAPSGSTRPGGDLKIAAPGDPREIEAGANSYQINAAPTLQSHAIGGEPILQRAVAASRVSCRSYGLHGGITAGDVSGADAVTSISASVDRALALATTVVTTLAAERARFATSGYTPTPDLSAKLIARFGADLSTPRGKHVVGILEREFRAVQSLLSGSYLQFVCRGADCAADDWAYSSPGDLSLALCNVFWNNTSLNLRGSTILHEAVHIWWDQVDDWGMPPLRNAHCFEQFALDLAGAAAEITPDVAGACVVPP